MTIDEIKLQEYENRFRNTYELSIELQLPKVRMTFTTTELMEIGMYLIELKNIKAGESKMKQKDPIGFLRKGEIFIYDGIKYKVGKLIEGTNGYVACTDENKKVRRFYIDTFVERVGGDDE